MYYTIKTATSYLYLDMMVDLCKSGNMYVVSAWNKSTHKTEKRFEYSRYEEAETAFENLRKQYGLNHVKNIEQDWDATDFD